MNHGLASIHLRRNEFRSAEKYLAEIDDEITSGKMTQQKLRHLKLSSEVAHAQGKVADAYEGLLTYLGEKEEIEENDKLDFRQEMETKYLTKEKEYEIELLNTEQELTDLKLRASNQRNWGLVIGLVLFAGLLFWLYRLWQRSKEQNRIISKANQEKEVLLKEIHHRVKNNLQVVSSLLTLQSKFVQDNKALEAINTGKARVQSTSILHRSLYQNDNLKEINIKDYFKELTENLMNTYKMVYSDIDLNLDVANIYLDVDTVVPMGLITNEIVCNALKHAFPDHEGRIDLSVKHQGDEIIMVIADDGIGMPFTDLSGRSETLGMQLIKSFARKLKAEVEIDNLEGTAFVLRFNIDNEKASAVGLRDEKYEVVEGQMN